MRGGGGAGTRDAVCVVSRGDGDDGSERYSSIPSSKSRSSLPLTVFHSVYPADDELRDEDEDDALAGGESDRRSAVASSSVMICGNGSETAGAETFVETTAPDVIAFRSVSTSRKDVRPLAFLVLLDRSFLIFLEFMGGGEEPKGRGRLWEEEWDGSMTEETDRRDRRGEGGWPEQGLLRRG